MQIGLLKLAPHPKESADTEELQLLDRVQETAESSGTLRSCKQSLYFRIIKGDILSTSNWIMQSDTCLTALAIESELGVP